MKQMQLQWTGRCGQGLDELRAELACAADLLPLAELCEQGGWPLGVKIDAIEVIADTQERFDARVRVSFTETGAACCSGECFETLRYGDIVLSLERPGGCASLRLVS